MLHSHTTSLRRCSLFLLALVTAGIASASVDPAQVAEARALFDQRKDAEAQAAFEKLAAADPQLTDAQFHLGMLALRRNDPEAANAFFKRAAELDPTSVSYQLRLGDSFGMMAGKAGFFSKLGLARKCRAQYEKAVALDPRNIEAHWSLLEYYKQAPGIAGGSIDRALEQANEITRIDASVGRFARATVYAKDKKFDEAFAPYANVLAAEPADYAALNQFGQLAMFTGHHQADGIKALQKCLTMTPPPYETKHAVIHAIIGRLHEMLGDKPAARVAYQAALNLDGNLHDVAEALKKLE